MSCLFRPQKGHPSGVTLQMLIHFSYLVKPFSVHNERVSHRFFQSNFCGLLYLPPCEVCFIYCGLWSALFTSLDHSAVEIPLLDIAYCFETACQSINAFIKESAPACGHCFEAEEWRVG